MRGAERGGVVASITTHTNHQIVRLQQLDRHGLVVRAHAAVHADKRRQLVHELARLIQLAKGGHGDGELNIAAVEGHDVESRQQRRVGRINIRPEHLATQMTKLKTFSVVES